MNVSAQHMHWTFDKKMVAIKTVRVFITLAIEMANL